MAEQTAGTARFGPVSSRVSFPEIEGLILDFWKREDIFRKSVEQREGRPRFILFEGPPTANGRPGIHHALSRAFKDIFPRYKAMRGFHAPRKGGWDTHGLPVELEVEKELGITSKQEIEEFGVEEFNRRCRESVFRYVKDWEELTERLGFWIDLDTAYVPYENDYIETAWWTVKRLWDHGLVYQGRRVAPHCPRCGTTLSSHEVALGYKDDTPDPSIYVKFELLTETAPEALRERLDGDPAYLLAWTTTPWTLPGNSGLCVAPGEEYVLARLEESGERVILAAPLAASALTEPFVEEARVRGAELAGARYRPLYDPVSRGVDVFEFEGGGSAAVRRAAPPADLSYPVVTADFVSMDDGAGIVHTAPPFGEDDYQAGMKNDLYFVQPVTLGGEFVEGYPWSGKFVKNADNAIIEDLKARGLLYRRETLKHTYPFCWRCDSPLLYYAKSSWYLRTTSVRDRLLSANEEINWRPEHIKHGRFGEWLRGNVDWAISRERFWGTPWPVWRCGGCGETEAIGGLDEVRSKPGVRGADEGVDLHRPYVDRITFDCGACGGEMRRVPEVMDVWFDSGIMPFAQWHYPFENKELIDGGSWYPADYICEGVDQTRGWFYSLHAAAALLEAATERDIEAPSYRNVISLGHILDEKGEKMSKSKGNVVVPAEVIDAHGADALRWYLYAAAPAGNSRRFSVDLVAEAVRTFLLTLWNTYSFFVTYANIDGFDPDSSPPPVSERPELDRWVLSKLQTLTSDVTGALDDFDATGGARAIQGFVDDLSNWYVRRSRRRFWKSENDADKDAAYHTLYQCLETVTRLLAPFTPFVAEEMYQNLVRGARPDAPPSVHLTDYPEADVSLLDDELAAANDLVIRIVRLGRAARAKSRTKVRQPLGAAVVAARGDAARAALDRLGHHAREELNVKEVRFAEESDLVSYEIKGNPASLGPKLGKEMGRVMGAIAQADAADLTRRARGGDAIEVAGHALERDDLDLRVNDREGFSTAGDHVLMVAVTTEITPALAEEGSARELAHRIQNLRRAAGFDIADRIVTYYQGSDEVATVFEAQGAYIAAETLSERIERAAPPAGGHAETQTVEGREVTLGVAKA